MSEGKYGPKYGSPNHQKVLWILTDTADIDACVIERVRVSVSSPNLRIVFGIANQAKCFYVQNILIFILVSHQWFQVTPLYLFVLIYLFYMLAIDSSY